jgi:hypothetical protein
MVVGKGTVFIQQRDQCTKPQLRSDMDPNVPERLLRPFKMEVWCSNNIIAVEAE